MTRNSAQLNNIREPSANMSITVADSNKIAVKAVGDLVQTVKTKRDINEILVKNVQFVRSGFMHKFAVCCTNGAKRQYRCIQQKWLCNL